MKKLIGILLLSCLAWPAVAMAELQTDDEIKTRNGSWICFTAESMEAMIVAVEGASPMRDLIDFFEDQRCRVTNHAWTGKMLTGARTRVFKPQRYAERSLRIIRARMTNRRGVTRTIWGPAWSFRRVGDE